MPAVPDVHQPLHAVVGRRQVRQSGFRLGKSLPFPMGSLHVTMGGLPFTMGSLPFTMGQLPMRQSGLPLGWYTIRQSACAHGLVCLWQCSVVRSGFSYGHTSHQALYLSQCAFFSLSSLPVPMMQSAFPDGQCSLRSASPSGSLPFPMGHSPINLSASPHAAVSAVCTLAQSAPQS